MSLTEEETGARAQCEFSESMTSEELSDWLLEQGIPDKYCKVFESKKHLCHVLPFIYLNFPFNRQLCGWKGIHFFNPGRSKGDGPPTGTG